MSTRFIGAWAKVKKSLGNAVGWLGKPSEKFLGEIGELVIKKLHERIDDNPPPALAASTIAKKRALGVSAPAKRWDEWGDMVEVPMLVEVESKRFGKSTVSVAIDPTAMHGKGLSYVTLALWLEYGTTRMPGRPVFGPFRRDLADGKVKDMDKIQRSLVQRIRASF